MKQLPYPVITSTNLPGFKLHSQGKVRDIYEVDDDTLLLITTDRMSAFDVILGEPIPWKGVILNQITLFWMNRFAHLIPNHIIESDVDKYPAALQPYRDQLVGRSVLARRAQPLKAECIVRGYIAGSGWKSYKKDGTVCGVHLPEGLKESDKLPEVLFTPSTKGEVGTHDENISLERMREIVGTELADKAAETSLAIYREASEYAASRGIIIADTKFEFGLVDGKLTLIDEVLTPDSSRFWPAEGYEPGHSQPSFDKQYLRDWLEAQVWDKTPPAPALTTEVRDTTAEKYQEAFRLTTRRSE
ncbi:phosphoribosylaminoimidazolesuccinocarboxamide synthase [uncultured Mailhella sp.]|uniref:phosphoribosylaminoimidazolesuccinocarboxamide synthase n=1 Tax=uncultured Mailhella sp. TaxID=1981031 RepID=UPI0025E8CC64|nr:phosphoribosylaminoimidazolesuccinocarboxamide synthase [uncultured Mailhella sp.]